MGHAPIDPSAAVCGVFRENLVFAKSHLARILDAHAGQSRIGPSGRRAPIENRGGENLLPDRIGSDPRYWWDEGRVKSRHRWRSRRRSCLPFRAQRAVPEGSRGKRKLRLAQAGFARESGAQGTLRWPAGSIAASRWRIRLLPRADPLFTPKHGPRSRNTAFGLGCGVDVFGAELLGPAVRGPSSFSSRFTIDGRGTASSRASR